MDNTCILIQAPRGLELDELPASLELDIPFEIGGKKYVMVRGSQPGIVICEESENAVTTAAVEAREMYVIKRVIYK